MKHRRTYAVGIAIVAMAFASTTFAGASARAAHPVVADHGASTPGTDGTRARNVTLVVTAKVSNLAKPAFTFWTSATSFVTAGPVCDLEATLVGFRVDAA